MQVRKWQKVQKVLSRGMKECRYEPCGKLFRPPAENPYAEYHSGRCWRLANGTEKEKLNGSRHK